MNFYPQALERTNYVIINSNCQLKPLLKQLQRAPHAPKTSIHEEELVLHVFRYSICFVDQKAARRSRKDSHRHCIVCCVRRCSLLRSLKAPLKNLSYLLKRQTKVFEFVSFSVVGNTVESNTL